MLLLAARGRRARRPDRTAHPDDGRPAGDGRRRGLAVPGRRGHVVLAGRAAAAGHLRPRAGADGRAADDDRAGRRARGPGRHRQRGQQRGRAGGVAARGRRAAGGGRAVGRPVRRPGRLRRRLRQGDADLRRAARRRRHRLLADDHARSGRARRGRREPARAGLVAPPARLPARGGTDRSGPPTAALPLPPMGRARSRRRAVVAAACCSSPSCWPRAATVRRARRPTPRAARRGGTGPSSVPTMDPTSSRTDRATTRWRARSVPGAAAHRGHADLPPAAAQRPDGATGSGTCRGSPGWSGSAWPR